jgi:hypothetical protein
MGDAGAFTTSIVGANLQGNDVAPVDVDKEWEIRLLSMCLSNLLPILDMTLVRWQMK